jgi:hypothetical protein
MEIFVMGGSVNSYLGCIIRKWLKANKKRLPQQARPPHPQRRLRMGIIVKEGGSGVHNAAIIQHFFPGAKCTPGLSF